MRRSQADSTNRSLAAFGKLQHILIESFNGRLRDEGLKRNSFSRCPMHSDNWSCGDAIPI